MKNNTGTREEQRRNSVLFIVAWMVALVVLEREITETRGLHGLVDSIVAGNWLPLVYLLASILLLALAIRSFMLSLRAENDEKAQIIPGRHGTCWFNQYIALAS